MPKKPNFDYERRERDKAKAAKLAEKAKIKSEKKASGGEVGPSKNESEA